MGWGGCLSAAVALVGFVTLSAGQSSSSTQENCETVTTAAEVLQVLQSASVSASVCVPKANGKCVVPCASANFASKHVSTKASRACSTQLSYTSSLVGIWLNTPGQCSPCRVVNRAASGAKSLWSQTIEYLAYFSEYIHVAHQHMLFLCSVYIGSPCPCLLFSGDS